MEECTSIAKVSEYVWKNELALQRLVDMNEECTSIAEVTGYVWKNALALQRSVDMDGRMHWYRRG